MCAATSTHGLSVRDSAVAILRQYAEMLESIDDTGYVTPDASRATIAAHTRHTLDHYRKLAHGYASHEVIDYDRRERGGEIELNRSLAIEEARSLVGVFEGLDETQLAFPVVIRAMVNGEGDEENMDSTLVREMWFVSHHAIHHAALMRPIFENQGVVPPAAFGRAPSTVNFEQAAD